MSSDCPMGTFCGSEGKCTAACVPGDGRCGDDGVCTSRGVCSSDGVGGGLNFPVGAAGAGSGSGACIDIDVEFTPQIPTVLLLVDQSGSMNASFGDGNRWNVLRDVLMDEDTGLVKPIEDVVRFGLVLYTGPQGTGQGNKEPSGEACPQLTEVAIGLDNHANMLAEYDPNDWKSETPTGDAINAIVPELEAYQEPGPKVIVLATDGEPDTCAEPNPQNGQEEAIAAVEAAYEKDIRTFVISVGTDVGEEHLRQVANVGQGFDQNDPQERFYVATDADQLASAFAEIVGGVRSCELALGGEVAEGQENQGVVMLDGERLQLDDANGYRLTNGSTLELLGDACDAIKVGDHDLSITFPCGTFTPGSVR